MTWTETSAAPRFDRMKASTERLWAKQDRHVGDRWRLFKAIQTHLKPTDVLYPGSYVDVAPSFVFPAVTYVDVDKRARQFFDDPEGVTEIIRSHEGSPPEPSFQFIHGDYSEPLDLAEESFDLLVSLYAGFISAECTKHLRLGGTLVVNSSHGDAAMASIDPRYELSAVVISNSGNYRIDSSDLDRFLVPKKPTEITSATLRESGRGVGYTNPTFAYLFTRVS